MQIAVGLLAVPEHSLDRLPATGIDAHLQRLVRQVLSESTPERGPAPPPRFGSKPASVPAILLRLAAIECVMYIEGSLVRENPGATPLRGGDEGDGSCRTRVPPLRQDRDGPARQIDRSGPSDVSTGNR